MEPRHLYTFKWSQPYSTYQQRPYLRSQHEAYEKLIERMLEDGDFKEANIIIERIKNASKSN
jgi:hypothetical protein